MLLGGELFQEFFVRRVLGLLFAGKLVLQVVLFSQEFPDLSPVMTWHTLGGGVENTERDFMHRIQLNNKKSRVYSIDLGSCSTMD